MALTREQILASDGKKLVKVDVPEWGDCVFVRTMTGAERDQYEKYCEGKGSNVRATLAALSIVDETGRSLFTIDDVDALAQKSGVALHRIFQVVAEINMVTRKDVEELEKN